jgi:WD40 repeat protein
VWSVVFSPDGRVLATGAIDGSIRLWDAAGGVALHTLTGHTALVRDLRFAPDGTALASAADDGTIRLWGPAP